MKTRFERSILPNLAQYGLSSQMLLASDRKTGEKPVISQPEKMGVQKEIKKYTKTEDMAILMYIIKNQKFKNVKGSKMWKLMEERTVAVGRSWSSMMARFSNVILKNIELYHLEKIDLDKFLAICE